MKKFTVVVLPRVKVSLNDAVEVADSSVSPS
jgi:hypothetical protein